MSNLKQKYEELKRESEKRYDDFSIEPISSIRRITDDAYLDNPTWLGGDEEFVCLFIDLDNSATMSFRHHPQTMAKLYDYFTQNIVDIITSDPFGADYIDIKGDGAFGIFEGEKAVFRALTAALTFKTFFEKNIRPKFQNQTVVFNCKLAIDQDKVLVKKIGLRGDNNEVWAGRVVNGAAKLASLTKEIYIANPALSSNSYSLLVLSDKVYKNLKSKTPYTTESCGHDMRGNVVDKAQNWTQYDCSSVDSVRGDSAWYTNTIWCDKCGDRFMQEMLK